MSEHHTPDQRAFGYLTLPEIRFLDAAVARLIPADERGPGAREADVTCFIDRQLVSTWGTHGRNYRMGPWQEGTAQQGFQSRLTPQEIYRAAIREIDRHCTLHYDRVFAFITVTQQDEVLRSLDEGVMQLECVSSRLFFDLLWRNTLEGFFSGPLYGGNRDKIGWKLIGFPGVASADYVDLLQKHNEPYRAEPISILDIVEQRAKVDGQGYPEHVIQKKNKPER